MKNTMKQHYWAIANDLFIYTSNKYSGIVWFFELLRIFFAWLSNFFFQDTLVFFSGSVLFPVLRSSNCFLKVSWSLKNGRCERTTLPNWENSFSYLKCDRYPWCCSQFLNKIQRVSFTVRRAEYSSRVGHSQFVLLALVVELAQRGEVVSHVEQSGESKENYHFKVSCMNDNSVIVCWGTTVLRYHCIFSTTNRLLQSASLVVGLGKSAVTRVSTSFSSTCEFAGYGYYGLHFSGYSHVQLGKILALGDALRILLQAAEESFAPACIYLFSINPKNHSNWKDYL